MSNSRAERTPPWRFMNAAAVTLSVCTTTCLPATFG